MAVTAEDGCLSYGELALRAERLAGHLESLGVGPDVRVGICLERSLEMVVGVVAVLTAGGAYVPLDPGYPGDRLAFMVQDAAVPVLLAEAAATAALPDLEARGTEVIDLARGALPAARQRKTSAPRRRAQADNLAYVIYTSGSTGRPKGVMMTHRGIVNRLFAGSLQFDYDRDDHILHKSSFSFDVSVWEIFWPLIIGARVVVARPGGQQDAAYLVRTIAEQEITSLEVPPSMLALFLDAPGLALCTSLRRISTGAEVLPYALVRRYFTKLRVPFHNLYGPTEAAIEAMYWFCDPDYPRELVPIGQPMANCRIRLLDGNLQRVPVGVPGHLHIGGAQLARGYLDRPELTAERFIPDPQGRGERLYATGDLARLLATGEMDFLGRIDNQVKVRGFRVELGEIETVLGGHPGVSEVVVTVRGGESGEAGAARIVAYVVPVPGAGPPELIADLKRRVRAALPDYMVPSVFVFLDAMPISPAGKLDVKALPAPESSGEPRSGLVAPRTPVEEVLAVIWASVLAVEPIGVEDDFFDLGGHSLLASQVVSRAREVFKVDLDLRSFFGAPTVASFSRVVEDAVHGGSQSLASAPPPLFARPRESVEPLSFGQQRFWFLHQLDRASTAYHIPVVLHLQGALSPAALEAALSEVVARHETLRTTFTLLTTGPVQVIAPFASWQLPEVDLAALAPGQREAETKKLAVAEVNLLFDLGKGPLLRTVLLRLAAEEHILLLVVHHIVSDAWSMALLWREVIALYRAITERQPVRLPALPIQYSDYSSWQREWLSGEVLAGELAWWRRQLAGAPILLELPTDRPRPPLQLFRGGRLEWTLPAEPTHHLKALGRREGATLFMVALAVFDILLGRYSRQEDVVIGFPIAGRNRLETESLIGLFLNTLALRVAVSPETSSRDLLRQVREVTLAAYVHQEVPFEKLVGELDLERSLAHAPLFQAMLVFQNTPAAQADLPGLAVRTLDIEMGTAKFDLILNLEESAAGLAGRWLYNSDLFDSATVRRISGHFAELVVGILADPDRRLAELPLLGPAERQQLLGEWNDSAADIPLEGSFPRLFAEQVRRSPAALAVACGEVELSYAELDARADRVARGLVAQGVGPEVVVAVLAERGIDLLAALLAIGKSGGAYLPLDPHHPLSRLQTTLEQSGARLVLVGAPLLDTGAELQTSGTGLRVLALAELLAGEGPGAALPDRALPENLAYLIFTSGSTGVPKGALLEQRGLVNHLATKILGLEMTAADRVAQTALQTFDISIWQFMAALLVGGSVHILPDELVRDPFHLLAEIERREITLFETVPALLSALLQLEPEHRPPLGRLRWLIPTGEALPPQLCRQWFAAYPDIPLLNAYGPTECSDDVAIHPLRAPLPAGTTRTPIGRPVANTRVYVLGPGAEPAPIGVLGELAVGGVQVGRGYGGRPELTADRFVPDPFAGDPGQRLYRTGDLARTRPSGELEFLGRIDHQVKVRGFRIELGDIESALADHPVVREVVVLAREDRASLEGEVDRRLVAYLVAEEGTELAVSDLRAFLHARLPEYMVPAAFVVLPALPLTPNGKVDRKALPAPDGDKAAGPQGFVVPRTELERALATLWVEILGRTPGAIGIHDPFFDIGGNSILGAVLINRLQKTLGEIVHVVALFDHPTVAGMAEYLLADYPEAVARIWGLVAEPRAAKAGPIDSAGVACLRTIVPPRLPADRTAKKNRPAVFILSAPRSGSTLLRVMLAGHPRLFAPPELELLSFDDMARRKAAFAGRNSFWLEGLIRAVMEIHHCGPEEATALVERAEAEGLPTRELYRRIEEWIGDRILVDKGSAYGLSRDTLERAEVEFEGALYLHLIRDPRAMIHSFTEAKLDQVFFPHAHPFSRRELAELIWVVSHQNIVQFLEGVPRVRQHWVRFEELVREPRAVLSGICDLLGLPFHPDMAEPYKEVESRMTDGIHAESRMLGDPKFLAHKKVDAGAAERWREGVAELPLGEPTHELAAILGYATRENAANAANAAHTATAPVPAAPAAAHPALVPLAVGGERRPLFLVHPIGGGVFWYLALARKLGVERPVYGLRSIQELTPPDLRSMARGYLEAVRQVQKSGPYFLGGWSMGAVVAYEMAQQLHAEGETVARLALIDPPPPATSQEEDDETTLLAGLASDLEGLSGRSLGMTRADLERLPPEERLARMLEACQAVGALPTEIDLAQFRELFTIFRQNRNALKTYVPEPYPGGLSLFLAAGATPDDANPSLAWQDLAAGEVAVRRLAGDHYSILRPPAVEAFAEILREDFGRGAP